MKKLVVVVVALVLVGCGGGSSGGPKDFAIDETTHDLSREEYDFSMERRDFASLSSDMSRSIERVDMGNPTAASSNGTNSTGSAVSSTAGSIIGGIVGALLNGDSKTGTGATSGGGSLVCPSGLDAYGYCYNNVAVWCDDSGTADAEDCGGEGNVCSYACPGYEGYAYCCSASDAGSTCTWSCQGTVLSYCDGDTSSTYDCSQNTDGNTDCGLGDDGYMGCVQSQTGACDGQMTNGNTYYGVTYQGICDGNVVVFCDSTGTLQSIDCDAEAETCTWVNGTVGYTCQ
jgi:hypothetical protein